MKPQIKLSVKYKVKSKVISVVYRKPSENQSKQMVSTSKLHIQNKHKLKLVT